MIVVSYKSSDGVVFTDPVDCASHELKLMPDFVKALNDNMEFNPKGDYWCSGGPCGCMGCVNHTFYKQNLTEHHYKAWKRDHFVVPKLSIDKPIKFTVSGLKSANHFKMWIDKNAKDYLKFKIVDNHTVVMTINSVEILGGRYAIKMRAEIIKKYKQYSPDFVFEISH